MSLMNFYVYGSLTNGEIHFNKFFSCSAGTTAGVIKGAAYRLEVGYPIVIKEGVNEIPGEIVTCQVSETSLRLMDEFHGFSRINPEKSLYIREEVSVRTQSGEMVQAQCYFFNPLKLPKSAKLIAHGNWQEDIRINPPYTSKLNEREKDYIRKLGNSSGREIVPYQLDLYRELTNKGIIVDKGRRLALTRFGQEVLRFIE